MMMKSYLNEKTPFSRNCRRRFINPCADNDEICRLTTTVAAGKEIGLESEKMKGFSAAGITETQPHSEDC